MNGAPNVQASVLRIARMGSRSRAEASPMSSLGAKKRMACDSRRRGGSVGGSWCVGGSRNEPKQRRTWRWPNGVDVGLLIDMEGDHAAGNGTGRVGRVECHRAWVAHSNLWDGRQLVSLEAHHECAVLVGVGEALERVHRHESKIGFVKNYAVVNLAFRFPG